MHASARLRGPLNIALPPFQSFTGCLPAARNRNFAFFPISPGIHVPCSVALFYGKQTQPAVDASGNDRHTGALSTSPNDDRQRVSRRQMRIEGAVPQRTHSLARDCDSRTCNYR
jgi:hypothetical protein